MVVNFQFSSSFAQKKDIFGSENIEEKYQVNRK